MESRGWWLAAVLLALLAAAGYAVFVSVQPEPLPEAILYGNGHIEAREVRLSPEVGGRILAIAVEEGDSVAQGGLIARIDDEGLRLELAEARARGEALGHGLERLERQSATARHHLGTARTALARAETLHEAGDLPAQALDEARDRLAEARGEYQALQARRAETQARQAALTQSVARLELQLERTRVISPVAGTVLLRTAEPGEFAVPGQTLATVADLDPLELKVYVPESDLGKVRLGADARVRVDSFPERYFDAAVSRVDAFAQFTPRDIHLPDERTRMVFGVTLRLANPAGVLKPGMPADAWIRWREDRPWPDTLPLPR